MATRLAAVALGAALLAGCGSSGGQSNSSPAAGSRTTSSAPAATASGGGASPLGKAITLPFGHTKLQVTVTKVLDPVPAPKQTGPYASDHVVAVLMSLKNVGTRKYAGSPSDYASLTTSGGERAPISPSKVPRCAKLGAGSVTVRPGSILSSCVAYDIGGSQQAATFTFRPSPKASGEWALR
jgi:hypothetical protein